MVPLALRQWLVLFFLCLVCGAAPLVLEPSETMSFLGFSVSESFAERLLGASMLGIGALSLFASRSHHSMIQTTVLLNVVWSGTSIFATVLVMEQSDSFGVWVSLLFFSTSCAVWMYWMARLAKTEAVSRNTYSGSVSS